MTAWRVRTFIAILGAVLGAAYLPAKAASDSPPQATTAPTPLGKNEPASSPDNAPAPGPDFKPGAISNGSDIPISSSELTIVDGPAAGPLDDSNGGFSQGMWVESRRADLEDLLARIPLVSADPVVRALSRRIVLTKSDAPLGSAKRTLLAIRVEKLLQAGFVDDAGALAASVSLDNDLDYARVQADALLYSGRDKDICPLTPARLSQSDPFWIELRLWCFLASGDTASAELTHGVMDAQGIKDAGFDVLVGDVLGGHKTSPPSFDHPSSLDVYLLRKASRPVSVDFAAKLGTIANMMAARETQNLPQDRLTAATRITQTGALTPLELRAILDAQTIAPDEIAKAQDIAVTLPFLPAQSILRRAASTQSRPGAKLDLLVTALDAAGHIDRLVLTAAMHSDLLGAVRPDMASNNKYLIARALVLDGKVDQASDWYGGSSQSEDQQLFVLLLDLALPTGARDAQAQAALEWFATQTAPQQNPSQLAALALGLFDALGLSMPQNARTLAVALEGTQWSAGSRQPSSDDMRLLAEAAAQPGRKGEAIVRVLDIIGASGPAGLSPDVIVACVRTLQQLGLVNEARALAVEALATSGPLAVKS